MPIDSQPPSGQTGIIPPKDKWWIGSQCLGTDICGGGTPFCINHSSKFASDGGNPPKARIVSQPTNDNEFNIFWAAGRDCPVQVIHPPEITQ